MTIPWECTGRVSTGFGLQPRAISLSKYTSARPAHYLVSLRRLAASAHMLYIYSAWGATPLRVFPEPSKMKFQQLLNDLRQELSELVVEIEGSSAMGHFDAHRIAEQVFLGVLRELLDLRSLRNLNETERANYPGIDLADDEAGVAVQITATPTLEKITDTLKTFAAHKLQSRYKRLIVYILTRKQATYSIKAIQTASDGVIEFLVDRDVLDFRNILSAAAGAEVRRVEAALEHLLLYKRGGVARGLAAEDLNPTSIKSERILLNAIQTFIPSMLYVADLLPEVRNKEGSRRPKQDRMAVREYLRPLGATAPSDYEVRSGQLLTFRSLEDPNPFEKTIDKGTITPIPPETYYSYDVDQERTFKSLLRFLLQQKLYRHRVRWLHEDGLFAFLPHDDADLLREERWSGTKGNTRTVYERKLNKKDENKTFVCKHFAFAVDFVLDNGLWLAVLAPDWYFSYGEDYRRSRYADESLAWLKRHENNKTVLDHFRFLQAWLTTLDTEDLLTQEDPVPPTLSFGDSVALTDHPLIEDERWLPLKPLELEDESFQNAKLFDWK